MSKHIFLCDGQGGVSPGMGKDLYETKEVFREAFDEANRYFSIDAKEISWGSMKFSVKNNPHFAHVYSLCNQYALFKYLTSIGYQCEIITGHSLGEIIALVLSGCVDLEQGAKWIEFRGLLFKRNMEMKSEMVAMIDSRDKVIDCVKELKKEINIYIANYNSKKQIIVSIKTDDMSIVYEKSLKQGIRPVNLNLGNGCHSIYVKPIEDELNAFIDKVEFNKPSIRFYSSSFNRFMDDQVVIKEHCKKHLLKEVTWEESMSNLINMGYYEFIELGYSKILKGLLIDIDKRANVSLSYNL